MLMVYCWIIPFLSCRLGGCHVKRSVIESSGVIMNPSGDPVGTVGVKNAYHNRHDIGSYGSCSQESGKVCVHVCVIYPYYIP